MIFFNFKGVWLRPIDRDLVLFCCAPGGLAQNVPPPVYNAPLVDPMKWSVATVVKVIDIFHVESD